MKIMKIITSIAIAFSIIYIPFLPQENETIESLSRVSEDGNPNRKFEKLGKTARTTNNYTGETYTDGLEYTLVEADHTASISAGTVTSGYVKLPSYYVDENQVTYTVTSIANNGFKEVEITSISQWPTLLTVIGKQAFMGISTMSSLSLPAGIREIYPSTFQNCKNLTYFSFHADSLITRIWDHSFAGCDYLTYTNDTSSGLVGFSLPAGLETIDSSAFAYCIGIPRIIIPSTVTTIKENAFYMCTSAVVIHIPSSVTTIEKYAFRGIKSSKIFLQATSVPSTFTTDWNRIGNTSGSATDSAIYIQIISGIDKIDIEQNMLYITKGGYAYIYEYTGNAASVTIPETLGGKTVVGIEENAFTKNKSIVNLTTNSSLLSIGKNAFAGCTSLATITLNEGLTTIEDYAFDMNDSRCNVTTITIPSSVVTIGEYAFRNFNLCQELIFTGASDETSQLNVIGRNCFVNLGANAGPKIGGFELIIPPIVDTTSSGKDSHFTSYIFSGAKCITAVTFANSTASDATSSLTSIGQAMFANCINLSTINWGNWIAGIRTNSFQGCSGLPYLYIPARIKRIDSSICPGSKITIYFEASRATYSTSGYTLNSSFATQNVTYDGSDFPSDYNGAFFNIGAESNIYRDTQGYYYFLDDDSYRDDSHEPTGTHITISGFVKTLNNLGLTANTGTMKIAESYTINGTQYIVKEIGRSAFAGNTYCTKIEMPNTIEIIGRAGLYATTKTLQVVGYTGSSYNNEYVLPTSLAYVCDLALLNSGLKKVVFPISVDFYLPKYYQTVDKIPETGTAGRLNIFYKMNNCEGFSLGTSYNANTTVGTNLISYSGCFYTTVAKNTNVCLIAVPRKTVDLVTYSECQITGMDLSKNQGNLKTITFNYGLRSIYGWIFENTSSIHTLTLPTSLWYISNNAFNGCSGISTFKTVDENGTVTNNGSIINFVTNKTTREGNLKHLGANIFDGNSNVTGIVLPISTNLKIVSSSRLFACSNAYVYVSDTWESFNSTHYVSGAPNSWTAGVWNGGTKETVYYKSTPPTAAEKSLRNYWRYVNDVPTIWDTTVG